MEFKVEVRQSSGLMEFKVEYITRNHILVIFNM